MLPSRWTVIQSTELDVFPVFVNSTPVSVTITLTFQAALADALPWIVYQYVPSQTLGTFPYGAAIVQVIPGQTVTTVFDVPSKGRIYRAPVPRFGEPFVLTYQVEDVLWEKDKSPR